MAKRANGEGSIYRDGDRWIAAIFVQDPAGKTVKRKFSGKTRKEVAARLAQAKQSTERNLPVASEKLTTGEFLQRWLEDAAKPTIRPKTYLSYEQSVRLHLAPALGKIPLVKLTPLDVQSYITRKLKSGLSPRTVQYHRTILRRALHIAESWGFVPRNVARLTLPPKVPRHELSPFTPEQARAFLGQIAGDRMSAVYVIALSMGLRQGEILALRWQDVDFEEGALTVRATLQRLNGEPVLSDTKTAKSRRKLAMPEGVMGALRAHRVRQAEERLRIGPYWEGERWGLVFTDELGRPFSEYTLRRQFAAHIKAAGLPHQRFHDLRHAAATFMLTQGVPLRVAMEVLGHSQIHVTANTYSHVMPELKQDAADRVGDLLFGTR